MTEQPSAPMDPKTSAPWWRNPKWYRDPKAIGLLVLLLIVVAILATAPARNAERERESAAQTARLVEAMAPRTVLYEVEGTALVAGLTMETPTGTSQVDVRVPMEDTSGSPGVTQKFNPGSFVYIAAQNQMEKGIVTCRITVDGVVISENTSSGAYGIATCDGTA